MLLWACTPSSLFKGGSQKETTGTDVSWTVEKEAYWQGPGLHVFARVKAYATDGSEEVLFSQPFMLTDQA